MQEASTNDLQTENRLAETEERVSQFTRDYGNVLAKLKGESELRGGKSFRSEGVPGEPGFYEVEMDWDLFLQDDGGLRLEFEVFDVDYESTDGHSPFQKALQSRHSEGQKDIVVFYTDKPRDGAMLPLEFSDFAQPTGHKGAGETLPPVIGPEVLDFKKRTQRGVGDLLVF